MKKNRNAFFSESNMNFQGFNPMYGNTPYQNANINSSFYSGMPPMMNNYSDTEERLAKLERQYNRLEHRINKLESGNYKSTDDFESNNGNMYML